MNNKIYSIFIFSCLTIYALNAQKIDKRDSIIHFQVNLIDRESKESIPFVEIAYPHPTVSSLKTDASGFFEDDFIVGVIYFEKSTGIIKEYNSFKKTKITFKRIGYESKQISIFELKSNSKILMIPDDDSRETSIGDISKPIDEIKLGDLNQTGQLTLDKSMHFAIPSFNSTNHPISDATAHFDPADLRNLGASRTLFLINGKRKNASALVYVNDTPQKGEVGIDMKSIPFIMLKSVEVLREGASSTFGSDAIAGVINFRLRDREDVGKTFAQINSGINSTGDGTNIGYDFFSGLRLGKNGFFNISHSFHYQGESYKSGRGSSVRDFRYPVSDTVQQWANWVAQNPSLKMTFGQPEFSMANVFYNLEHFLNEGGTGKFYSFGGLTYRNGTSFAIYRAPYVVSDPYNFFHTPNSAYSGFQPKFTVDNSDKFFTFGSRFKENNLSYDLSYTFGQNDLNYTVEESYNPSLGASNPKSFRPGGYSFKTGIADFEVSNRKSNKITSFTFGAEFRTEQYTSKSGDLPSFTGSGVISFPGIRPEDALTVERYNFGSYLDILSEIPTSSSLIPKISINGTARIEKYSDFGLNWSGKGEVFIPFEDKGSIRSSISRCFRAPSLHQRYFSATQTISLVNQGTFNNESPVIRALGIPRLKQETSTNYSVGIFLRPFDNKNISLGADYFFINIDDRILYSSSITSKDTTEVVGRILKQNNISSLKFFANAANTSTNGADIHFKWDNISINERIKLAIDYNSTFSNTRIRKLNFFENFASNDSIILDRKERSRLLFARPTTKHILSINMKFSKFSIGVRNTFFGKVRSDYFRAEFSEEVLSQFDQEFRGKIITDINATINFGDNLNVSFYINNVGNIFPDPINTELLEVPFTDATPFSELNLGGRFKYLRDVSQFGYNGLNFNVRVGLRLR